MAQLRSSFQAAGEQKQGAYGRDRAAAERVQREPTERPYVGLQGENALQASGWGQSLLAETGRQAASQSLREAGQGFEERLLLLASDQCVGLSDCCLLNWTVIGFASLLSVHIRENATKWRPCKLTVCPLM